MYEFPLETGLALIIRAAEAEQDERLHRQWSAQLPFMTSDTFISFSDYRDRCTGRNIDKRPTGTLVAELLTLQAEMETEQHGT